MSNRYKCIESFYLPMLDENENEIENEEVRVEKGTVWERQEVSYLSDVRLENDTGWIEIANESLARYFKELTEEQTDEQTN
ncbi:hypothetical protein [Alkalibacterium thalassium]|uniref:Uncharacterized protein n=1 Tax=Alkalibacterium thalassium TaxID=426701 RepID=A0A1G8VTU2_9LACT|nr:hypothetical protein [Alkalibacterium thalassium]SDJ68630.1 hypothetical protein SAMN04488098_100273 [Alkalibacterium thalassium]